LAMVSDGYYWDSDSGDAPLSHNRPDFGHVVEVDPDRLVTVRRDSSLEARTIAEKLQRYRQAITPVRQDHYAGVARRLFGGDDIHYI
jgi:hypothetical protein